MSVDERLTPAAVGNLDLAIRDLSDEVQVLRTVLDEIREDISYAVRNNMLVVVPIPASAALLKSLTLDVDDVIQRVGETGEKLRSLKSVVSAECERPDVETTVEEPRTGPARAVADTSAPPPSSAACAAETEQATAPVSEDSADEKEDGTQPVGQAAAGPTRTGIQQDLFPADDAGEDPVPDSVSPAESSSPAGTLLRPDRQIIFECESWEWPAAEHDTDTITVDRIGENTTGGPHRFVIKRGDTVQAHFNSKRMDTGTVCGISHAKQEVRVRFDASPSSIR